MQRVATLYQSSVGKKVLMAASGMLLFGFVLGHMAGNLKIYQGAAKYDAYARFLKEIGYPALGHGQALWIARILLLAAVGIHILAAIQLTARSHKARKSRYQVKNDLSFTYASRTMRWGGVILATFVVYHLLHLTLGLVDSEFSHDSAYHNVVSGFQVWWVSLAYLVAMVPLALHVYHGVWSATQTLALENARVRRWRRPFAAAVAILIFVGNVSIPISVLVGIVR